mgnify:CR=1 FL=1
MTVRMPAIGIALAGHHAEAHGIRHPRGRRRPEPSAHGPGGDDTPGDPAYLYWMKAKKDKSGFTTFEPHLVDDDSGIGTQFAVEDVDGDGLLDIIVSNKKGVCVIVQERK